MADEAEALVASRGWRALSVFERIGAVYDYVRCEVAFGYNAADTLPASRVLADGYGQCNTKATLMLALLRAVYVPCRLRGAVIDKALQRGIVPEAVYPLAPREILHSWVELRHAGVWTELEGFILDPPLQARFAGRDVLCAYGVGTDYLQAPDVAWTGTDTFIQKTGITREFGVFASPDMFYAEHSQLTGLRGLIYRHVIRHWMNARVARMRKGDVPVIPSGAARLVPAQLAQKEEAA